MSSAKHLASTRRTVLKYVLLNSQLNLFYNIYLDPLVALATDKMSLGTLEDLQVC